MFHLDLDDTSALGRGISNMTSVQARIAAGFILLSAGSVAVAAGAPAEEEGLAYTLVLFLHQILFVFWLGPDIGVYMWSTKAANTELSPAQRVAAGRIMEVIELLPRVCMSLMLTVGGVLTELKGIDHPWWQMAAIWLLGPVWLTLTLLVYAGANTDRRGKLAGLDELFRWAVIVSVILSVGYSVVTDRLADFPWITAKLLIFAAVVFFGLMMRRRLAPFLAAIHTLESDGPTDETNARLAGSLARARLFMFATWVALAMAAALGIYQPGSPEQPVESVAPSPGLNTAG
jgi:hypothetical protein